MQSRIPCKDMTYEPPSEVRFAKQPQINSLPPGTKLSDWWLMSHSNLDSTPSKLLDSQTSTVGWWTAWLWLGILGRGLTQRIGKLKLWQDDIKITQTRQPPSLSVVAAAIYCRAQFADCSGRCSNIVHSECGCTPSPPASRGRTKHRNTKPPLTARNSDPTVCLLVD